MSALLSIDLSHGDINIVTGSANQANVNIEKAVTVSLPDGCLKDGKITDLNTLKKSISEALQFGDFNCNRVALTINDAAAVIRDLEIPFTNAKNIKKIVQNEMTRTYFVDDDSIIEFKVTGNKTDEQGNKKILIRAAAIDGNLVSEYYELLKELKLKPQYLDINVNCIDKLITPQTVINNIPLKDSTCFLLDFDGSYTNIYIINNGNQAFYRHTNLGLSEIKRLLTEKSLHTPEEIDELIKGGSDFFGDSTEAQSYFNMLKPFFYQLSDELQKMGQFYSNRMNGQTIDNYFLSGSGCVLTGLAEYLSNRLNTPVSEVESISNVNCKGLKNPLSFYLNAAGALIRY